MFSSKQFTTTPASGMNRLRDLLRRYWRWAHPEVKLDGTWRDWFPTWEQVWKAWLEMILLTLLLATIWLIFHLD